MELVISEFLWEYAIQSFDEITRDRPRGTIDALCSAKHLIHWPFVVCNWDDIYWAHSFKLLFDHLQQAEESASLGYILENVIPDQWSTNRWIFTVDEANYVQDVKEYLWIEKNALSAMWLSVGDLCSMNIFWFTTGALELLNDALLLFKADHLWDRKAECYLPSEVANIMRHLWENQIAVKRFVRLSTKSRQRSRNKKIRGDKSSKIEISLIKRAHVIISLLFMLRRLLLSEVQVVIHYMYIWFELFLNNLIKNEFLKITIVLLISKKIISF